MTEKKESGVERLFPFAMRARILLVGRETVMRSRSKLHFLLITTDITENSKEELLKAFGHYPVVQHYAAADLERHFGLRNTKVLGFAKSTLAQSIYAELKQYRLNQPASGAESKPKEQSSTSTDTPNPEKRSNARRR